jgi:surfactin synthase thioesterase subunit
MDTLGSKDGRMNLFCLPFAGGSSYHYREFQKFTASFIHIIPIELPGRGRRFSEPLLTDIHEMVEDVLIQIRPELDKPYAIYGHSLGAKLGYLLTKRIINGNLPEPLHLFLSGCEGPSIEPKERNRHLLPRKEFMEMLNRFEGTPVEVLENRELMDFFEPVIRADFQAVDTYVYNQSKPFDIPVTVMIGKNERFTPEGVMKWQDITTRKISVKEFPGGHFFLFNHLPKLGKIFSECCFHSGTHEGEDDRDILHAF